MHREHDCKIMCYQNIQTFQPVWLTQRQKHFLCWWHWPIYWHNRFWSM